MSKLLLHVCCAPCVAVPFKRLKEEGFDISVYYENSNIWPKEEYEKRLGEVEKYVNVMRSRNTPRRVPTMLYKPKYDHLNWLKIIKGLEKEPEGGKRCEVCFRFRMEEAVKYAKENEFDYFAVVFTISPHKNATMINQIGRDLADKYGMKYYEADFKKQDGFKESLELSRKYGFYRQNYCGCEFSRKGNRE